MANIKVLLVDDDPVNLSSMKDYLEDVQQLRVSAYENGSEAFAALQDKPHEYDVLLLDWTLTPMSGSTLMEKVKEINPDLPMIVFTGNAEAGAEAYGSGAYTYFRKPVDLARLVQAIQSATHKKMTVEDKSLVLSNINTLLIEQQTLELFASAIISKANSLVDSTCGSFYLWKWESRNFQELAHVGSGLDLERRSLPESSLNEFLSRQTDILVDNTVSIESDASLGRQMKAQATILLRRADMYLGLLILGKTEGGFTKEDEQSLHALKAMVAPLLEQIKVRERLQAVQQKNYTTEDELCLDAVNMVFEVLGKPTVLWLINQAQTELTIRSSFGVPESYRTNTHISLDDQSSLLASAIRRDKIEQTSSEGVRSSEITVEIQGMQSELAIPLFTFEQAPMGGVTLFSDQVSAFKEYDIQLVQYFVTQVTRLLDTLRRQSQSKRISEIGEMLVAQAQDEDTTFKIFAEVIREFTGADTVAIYPYDPQRQHYYKNHIHATDKGAEITADKLEPRLKGLAYVVRYIGKIVVDDTEGGVDALQAEHLETIPGTPQFTKAFLSEIIQEEKYIRREKIRAFVGISLRSSQGQDEVGVMYVDYRFPRRFTNSEIQLLQIVAGQAASVIQSRRTWVQQRVVSDALKEIIAVVGTMDPLTVILKQTAKLFSADHGSISRITQDGQHLQYKALWEDGKINDRSERFDKQEAITEGITGHVVQTGEHFRTGDVKTVDFYQEWYAETKSELAVPLKNAFGGIVGVLNLESNNENAFTEGDEELCKNFAQAASAAIQQSDLFEAIQSLHPFTESHSLKELFDVILKNLNKMMGVNTASSVNLYDSKNEGFYAYYGVGPNPDFVNKYLLVPPRNKGTGRHVLKTKKPLYYDDVNNISRGLPKVRPESKQYRIVSFAVLPLIYRDELLGALFIHKIGEPTKFTDIAKRILETFATQAALAIHTAQHHIDLDPLKEILNATVSEQWEKILNLIVKKAVDIVNSDYSSLWLGETGTGNLVRQAIYVKPGENVDLRTTKINTTMPSVNMTVFTSKKPKLINDLKDVDGYNRIYEKAQSEMAVPLIYRDEILGTLNTESQRLGAYSELDIMTLRVFADVAAIVIKIAQAREEVQKKNEEIQTQNREILKKNEEIQTQNREILASGEELNYMNYRLQRRNAAFEALTEIGQQLTANIQHGEQQILSIIHQQASHIMDTDNMYIALYEPDRDLVRFELAYLDGKPEDIEHDERWKPRSGGQGRTEWIIRNKRPILTYTKVDAEKWYQQPETKDYIGQKFASWLGVPILFGDEVLGVIATYHKTDERKYGPDDQTILALMGRQAAIALTNARLVRQLDNRIHELDTIRQLGEDLSQNAMSPI